MAQSDLELLKKRLSLWANKSNDINHRAMGALAYLTNVGQPPSLDSWISIIKEIARPSHARATALAYARDINDPRGGIIAVTHNIVTFTPAISNYACSLTWHITDDEKKKIFTLLNIDTGWNDQELLDAVKAYVEMQNKESSGQQFIKTHYYKLLAEKYGRTEKSFEYRMQNISFVLQNMGKKWLTGLKPAKNVGTHIADKIEKYLLHEYGEKSYRITAFETKKSQTGELYMNKFDPKRMLVIDMHSGRYAQERTGHEIFNLERNPIDGRFYGYCPPHDNIDICTNFGAKSRQDCVEDILVVYVAKKANSNDREIIAFMPCAKIHGTKQPGEKLSRSLPDSKDQVASYSVEGEILVDLRNRANKFEIEIAKYNTYIFRMQRYYGGGYPDLDKQIIAYIEGILEDLLDDDIEEQKTIQRSEPATPQELQGSADRQLNIVDGSQGKAIAKDGRLSKAALERAKYLCQINPKHETFTTTRGVPYMEGHHLIPCTITNAKHFWEKDGKNIDCVENIICICPNCHRAVHFGDESTREAIVKTMYDQQAEQLILTGITITEEGLLALYTK